MEMQWISIALSTASLIIAIASAWITYRNFRERSFRKAWSFRTEYTTLPDEPGKFHVTQAENLTRDVATAIELVDAWGGQISLNAPVRVLPGDSFTLYISEQSVNVTGWRIRWKRPGRRKTHAYMILPPPPLKHRVSAARRMLMGLGR